MVKNKQHFKKKRKGLEPKTRLIQIKKWDRASKRGKIKDDETRVAIYDEVKSWSEPVVDPFTDAQPKKNRDDIPLVEMDYDFKPGKGRNLDTLTGDELKNIGEYAHFRTVKKKQLAGDLEERYQEKQEIQTTKQLLPTKNRTGLTKHSIEVEVKTEEEEEVEEDNEVLGEAEPPPEVAPPVEKPMPEITTADLLAQRHTKVRHYKNLLAGIAHRIIENPEENIMRLRELRGMLTEPETAGVTIQKMLMVTITEVFKDILPDYRIRPWTEKEKAVKHSKSVKTLAGFEDSLVTNYKLFLSHCESVAKGRNCYIRDGEEEGAKVNIPEIARPMLRHVAVRCLCELLYHRPRFNYRTNIISTVVPFANHRNKELARMVCEYLGKMFKQDGEGDISLEIVRLIGRIVKAKNYNVLPTMLESFLCLRIRNITKETEAPKRDKAPRAEREKLMSRRDRKQQKQTQYLDKELKHAAVIKDHERIIEVHTQIVTQVFLTYFRVMKRAVDSKLLTPVLEGVAKFAHLINVDFFEDMFQCLNDLNDSGLLDLRDSLNCIKTIFTIMMNYGAVLNIDAIRFYRHLFAHMYDVHAGDSEAIMSIVVECMHLMVTKRKKQVSQSRTIAFMKRLMTMSLQLQSHGSLAALGTVRNLLSAFPSCDALLDTELVGSGLYDPDAIDPDRSNAQNTSMWEVYLLKKHYHPTVKQYAGHLLTGSAVQGRGDILRCTGHELWEEYNVEGMVYNPDLPPKHPRTRPIIKPNSNYFKELTETTDVSLKPSDIELEQLGHSIQHRHAVQVKDEPIDGILSSEMILEGWSDGENEDEEESSTDQPTKNMDSEKKLVNGQPTETSSTGKKRTVTEKHTEKKVKRQKK